MKSKCPHKWEITLRDKSPGGRPNVPQLRHCVTCGLRQYKVWTYDTASGHYRTYWRS
jgi:hypothetical protein